MYRQFVLIATMLRLGKKHDFQFTEFLFHSVECILIFIRKPRIGFSLQFLVELPVGAHVLDIESIIANDTHFVRGLETDDYVLTLDTKILNDERTLSDSAICAESALEIVVCKEDLSGIAPLFRECNDTEMTGIHPAEWYYHGEIMEHGVRSIRKDERGRHHYFLLDDSDRTAISFSCSSDQILWSGPHIIHIVIGMDAVRFDHPSLADCP